MPVSVLIPTPLRNLTQSQDTVEVQAETVTGLVNALESAYPGMGGRLRGEDGALRRFINIYVNDEDIRFIGGEAYAFQDGDEVMLIPSIAGGTGY